MSKFRRTRYITTTILLIGILLVFMGCKKVTADNYKKLTSGMTYEQVVEIIGEPTSCEAIIGVKSCVWKDGEKAINVKFLGDKVLLFSSSNL